MPNNPFQDLAKSAGTKVLGQAASAGITGAMGGGGLAGAMGGISAVPVMGTTLGGIGSAATGMLAAMGPIGWAALAAGGLYAAFGNKKSRFDKLKSAFSKGAKTGDFSKFNERMEKWPKAASRFENSTFAKKVGYQPGMTQGQQQQMAPGMQGQSPQYQPNPMSPQQDFQRLLPQTMATPGVLARPEAAQWLQNFMPPPAPMAPPQSNLGPGLYANGGPPPSWAAGPMGGFGRLAGQMGTPGPDMSNENRLQQFLGTFGNGGGQTAPQNIRDTMMVNPGKGFY